MQSRRGRENDEIHHQVREEHSREYISSRAAQLVIGGAFPLGDSASSDLSLFFHFLRGLPEEKIRRNRRPQNPDERREIIARPLNMRDKGRAQHRSPVRMCEKRRDDVSKQDQREPFENFRDVTIRGPEKQRDNQHRINRCPDVSTDAGHHPGRFSHATQIGADVDDVRDD